MIPDLESPYPPCSVCGEDTWHDGNSLRCDDCGIYWADGLSGGAYLEYGKAQCESTVEWFNRPDLMFQHENIRHTQYRCRLPHPHIGKPHRYDWLTTWGSDDPHVVSTVVAGVCNCGHNNRLHRNDGRPTSDWTTCIDKGCDCEAFDLDESESA